MFCHKCEAETPDGSQFCHKCGQSLGGPPEEETKKLSKRIKELGDKATQLLAFLSFAIVAAVIVAGSPGMMGPCQKSALRWALRFWVGAFVPILVNVVPVKEFCWETPSWYRKVRLGKVILLWLAVILIFAGVVAFLIAMWQVPLLQRGDPSWTELTAKAAIAGVICNPQSEICNLKSAI